MWLIGEPLSLPDVTTDLYCGTRAEPSSHLQFFLDYRVLMFYSDPQRRACSAGRLTDRAAWQFGTGMWGLL